MSDSSPPQSASERSVWLLLSVLFSSVPLSEALAVRLQKTAFELYAADERARRITGPALQGEVRNLQKSFSLGGLSGPAFEAELETERGQGTVRFMLTQEGLALLAKSRPRHLMN